VLSRNVRRAAVYPNAGALRNQVRRFTVGRAFQPAVKNDRLESLSYGGASSTGRPAGSVCGMCAQPALDHRHWGFIPAWAAVNPLLRVMV
jgi:hypothetical protein